MKKRRAWIGANDRRREGRWIWSDGCPLSYRRWNRKEPNNSGNEDCGHLITNRNGLWNDIKCHTRMGFVCKRIRKNYKCGKYHCLCLQVYQRMSIFCNSCLIHF